MQHKASSWPSPQGATLAETVPQVMWAGSAANLHHLVGCSSSKSTKRQGQAWGASLGLRKARQGRGAHRAGELPQEKATSARFNHSHRCNQSVAAL